ncbi:hypothetical protein J5J86_21425 [Aquabacter sp. L1I39]|uniref:hypothetical protein n=1 Tax=Aquabacter sp. L1I39 TaxID=2820278 RepID=UPI001ADD2564|nr:hypothetical protein [Aquabacter sp. L1I39]QTL03277.1 hypothetical protein J5J86_21425 [Aquabacter sp. L1I39]
MEAFGMRVFALSACVIGKAAAVLASGIAGCALALLASASPAHAQSAAEVALYILTGEQRAPVAGGQYVLDHKWAEDIELAGDRNATLLTFHRRWRLQPLDACRYLLFRLDYSTTPSGRVLDENDDRRNNGARFSPRYTVNAFDFRNLVSADLRDEDTLFTFTTAVEGETRVDPRALMAGRMVAFDAREFPATRSQPTFTAGGDLTNGSEIRFARALKYMSTKFCPRGGGR